MDFFRDPQTSVPHEGRRCQSLAYVGGLARIGSIRRPPTSRRLDVLSFSFNVDSDDQCGAVLHGLRNFRSADDLQFCHGAAGQVLETKRQESADPLTRVRRTRPTMH